MLDVKFIRENTEKVKKDVADKNFDAKIIDQFLELDEKRRKLLQEVQKLGESRNAFSRLIKGKPTEEQIKSGKTLRTDLENKEKELREIDEEYQKLLWKIPNIHSDDTPLGKDESENKVIRSWGNPKKFDFKVRDHMDIGRDLGIIDVDTAGKVTGARFNYLKGDLVLLQNALHQFAISVLTNEKVLKEIAEKVKHGYSPKAFIPVVPPLMINPEVYRKMARLTDETEIERYALPRDNQYLIGSAEHTLGPMHLDETLNEKDLPLRYFAFTAAFRREAGASGKDTRGILRQHQFDKLEMESFTTPENGLNEQDFFIGIQEYLMQKLNLPYQVVAICTGDMGGPDFRQMDINTWMPGQDAYRETHTSDYMTDYQSRRLNTKVKIKDVNEFVYMNDATAFAMGRTMIAILENYQNEDGSVEVPEVLQKWVDKKKIEKSKNG